MVAVVAMGFGRYKRKKVAMVAMVAMGF